MTSFLRIDNPSNHWQAHARQWSRIGTPLRPHADDVSILQRWLDRHAPPTEPGRGLLLGATPELARMGPHAIVAVDRERAMIDMLRAKRLPNEPADESARPGQTRAIEGDWLQLPFAPGSFDFALGDGSFNLLRFPHDYDALLLQLRRVLQPRAPLLLRLFTTPARGECSADVITAALAGRIGNFHAFKWRLAMSLVATREDANIAVVDILDEFERLAPDRHALAARAGWTLDAIDTIDVYRGSAARYSFPRLHEWRTIAGRHGAELECAQGNYELADRCPLLCIQLHA